MATERRATHHLLERAGVQEEKDGRRVRDLQTKVGDMQKVVGGERVARRYKTPYL